MCCNLYVKSFCAPARVLGYDPNLSMCFSSLAIPWMDRYAREKRSNSCHIEEFSSRRRTPQSSSAIVMLEIDKDVAPDRRIRVTTLRSALTKRDAASVPSMNLVMLPASEWVAQIVLRLISLPQEISREI